MASMIRFDRVAMAYTPGGAEALRDISFSVEAGELLLLTGHSGAGKSTLLKLIAAVERPSRGRIEVRGQDITALHRSAIPYLRRSLGLIFQDRQLLNDRSVFDNVLLPLAISGEAPKEAARRVQAALERVGLDDRAKDRPLSLSGGEQQRLAIARAIVNRPAVLLADEPTAHLDADYAAEIVGLLHSFQQAGVTVLVATHDASQFAVAAPRQIKLDHGSLSVGGVSGAGRPV